MDVYDSFLLKFRVADSTKSDYDREQDFIEERMTGRDRPHSRNDAVHGAPATWNEKKRITEKDPDISGSDRDMSLNYKTSAKAKVKREDVRKAYKAVKKFEYFLSRLDTNLSNAFKDDESEGLLDLAESNPSRCFSKLDDLKNLIMKYGDDFKNSMKSSDDYSDSISEAWNSANDVYKKAGIFGVLKKLVLDSKTSGFVKKLIAESRTGKINNPNLIKSIIKESGKNSHISKKEIDKMVMLVVAYEVLLNNPKHITPAQIKNDKLKDEIFKQVNMANELDKITSSVFSIIKKFKDDDSDKNVVSEGNWGAVLSKLNNFFNRPGVPVPIDLDDYMKVVISTFEEEHGSVPDKLKSTIEPSKGKPNEDKLLGDESKTESGKDKPRVEFTKDKPVTDKPKEESFKSEVLKDKPLDKSKVEPIKNKEDSSKSEVPRDKPKTEVPRDKTKKIDRKKRLEEIEKSLKELSEGDELKKKKKVDEIEKSLKELSERDKSKKVEDELTDQALKELSEIRRLRDKKQKGSDKSAASYEEVDRKMTNKTSAYHGIVYQGHPTDPLGSSDRLYDKRYFGKEHYESIISSAKEFLSEDWLKHGWGDNPGDVPVRAALDLAIYTADSGLYQSKIDSMTYNMLLNKLAGWDYDVFNETVLNGKKTRKASVMTRISSAHAILKIADDLRKINPSMSIQLIKNVHSMMRSAASADEINKWIEEFSKKFEGNEDVLDELMELKDIVENSSEESIPARKPDEEDEKTKISSEIRLLKTVVKLAQTKPEYKKYIPVILAKITKNKKKKSEKKSEKDEKPVKSAAPSKSEKKEDKKKSDKKDKSSSKKKKASVSLSVVDTNW